LADAAAELLRSRIRQAKHEARAEWESQLADLERRRRAALVQLTNFRAESTDAWQALQTGLEKTWSALNQSCQEALDKFKE
jgi:hypothetical protein